MNCGVVAILFAVAQASSPISSKTSRPAHAAHDVKDHSSNDIAPSAQSPPTIDAKAAPNHDATANQQRTDDAPHSISISKIPPVTVAPPKRDWADWGYWGFNLLLVLVGGVQVWLLCQTLRAVRQQRNAMLRQLVAMRQQVSEMTEQTGILQHSVAAADKTAEAADKNASALVSIERAWLVVEVGVPRTLTENIAGGTILQGVGFTWIVRNCGKTSAFITRVGARFHAVKAFSELPLEPNIDMPGVQAAERYASGVPIGPGGTIRRCRMLEGENRHPTAAEEKLIADGALTYLGYGVIEYRTVLDEKTHVSWFCHRWLPGSDDPFPPSPVPANYTQYT
jgi:hypothetical protein